MKNDANEESTTDSHLFEKNCDAYHINYLLCSVLFVFFHQECLEGVDFPNNLGNAEKRIKNNLGWMRTRFKNNELEFHGIYEPWSAHEV